MKRESCGFSRGRFNTTDTYTCKYCGKEKSWNDRNYDVGLWLAEIELAALQDELDEHKEFADGLAEVIEE